MVFCIRCGRSKPHWDDAEEEGDDGVSLWSPDTNRWSPRCSVDPTQKVKHLSTFLESTEWTRGIGRDPASTLHVAHAHRRVLECHSKGSVGDAEYQQVDPTPCRVT